MRSHNVCLLVQSGRRARDHIVWSRYRAYRRPVLATWIIRSKIGTWRRTKFFFTYLQTQTGRCTIGHRHQHPHARTTLCSCDGEASCMARVLKHLRQLKKGCLDAVSSRFARWTTPLGTSLPLSTLADLGRSKSELLAEIALLRKPLIILQRQVKRPLRLTHFCGTPKPSGYHIPCSYTTGLR